MNFALESLTLRRLRLLLLVIYTHPSKVRKLKHNQTLCANYQVKCCCSVLCLLITERELPSAKIPSCDKMTNT